MLIPIGCLEKSLIKLEYYCRNYLEAQIHQVIDISGWELMRERSRTWLEKLETNLLSCTPVEGRHRVEVFLTGVRWEIGYALENAQTRYQIYGKIQPLVATTLKENFYSLHG